MKSKRSSFKGLLLVLMIGWYQPTTQAQYRHFSQNTKAIKPDLASHSLVSEALWNALFPYRFGAKDTGGGTWVLNPKDDFYTYASFVTAIQRMQQLKAEFKRRCGTNAYHITRIDKVTGERTVLRNDPDFDAPRNQTKEVITTIIDYGNFLERGSIAIRTRELMAFLANIAHETTGGWDTAPGGRFSWGLHFREEPTTASYAYPDANYPPTPGKSYKGRGPIQLSYNYNYGMASAFLFGDKQVLLDNPDLLLQDAALAFQTAIWFWMTPQYPKPSAHEVMTNLWKPNTLDLKKQRIPGFGMTVNIINGGVECGQGIEKSQVLDRIGYYRRFSEVFGVGTDMDGVHDLSDCGCKDTEKYGGDSADLTAEPCAQKPVVSFTNFGDVEVIEQRELTAIGVQLAIDVKGTKLRSLQVVVGSQIFKEPHFSWIPDSYGIHELKAKASFVDGQEVTTTAKVLVWDGKQMNCSELPQWKPVIYEKSGNFVRYKDLVYKNKWYVAAVDRPGESTAWEYIYNCVGDAGTSCGATSWAKVKVYTRGQRVHYKAKLYEALWWTQGNIPGNAEVWKVVGECPETAKGKLPKPVVLLMYNEQTSSLNIWPKEANVKQVQVFSSVGNLVYAQSSKEPSEALENRREVSLPAGIYYYKIQGSVYTYQGMFVKR